LLALGHLVVAVVALLVWHMASDCTGRAHNTNSKLVADVVKASSSIHETIDWPHSHSKALLRRQENLAWGPEFF
jgi:hypothetical protein